MVTCTLSCGKVICTLDLLLITRHCRFIFFFFRLLIRSPYTTVSIVIKLLMHSSGKITHVILIYAVSAKRWILIYYLLQNLFSIWSRSKWVLRRKMVLELVIARDYSFAVQSNLNPLNTYHINRNIYYCIISYH